jgi:hypothetical protein
VNEQRGVKVWWIFSQSSAQVAIILICNEKIIFEILGFKKSAFVSFADVYYGMYNGEFFRCIEFEA